MPSSSTYNHKRVNSNNNVDKNSDIDNSYISHFKLGQGKEPEPVWTTSNLYQYKDLTNNINPNNKVDTSSISVRTCSFILGQDKNRN